MEQCRIFSQDPHILSYYLGRIHQMSITRQQHQKSSTKTKLLRLVVRNLWITLTTQISMWWIALSNVSKTGTWKVSSKKQLRIRSRHFGSCVTIIPSNVKLPVSPVDTKCSFWQKQFFLWYQHSETFRPLELPDDAIFG